LDGRFGADGARGFAAGVEVFEFEKQHLQQQRSGGNSPLYATIVADAFAGLINSRALGWKRAGLFLVSGIERAGED